MAVDLKELIAQKRQQAAKTDDLLATCAAACIKCELNLDDFRIWTEWLGVYRYIVPDDRVLSFDMCAFLTKGAANTEGNKRARIVFKAWLLADIMETCLTEEQQRKTISYLLQSTN